MNDLATQFWPVLWRTTLTLTLAALLCGLILRPARPRSPLVHRVGWLATLLVGWSLLRLTVPVAWYDAPQAAPTHEIDVTLPTSLRQPLPTVAQRAGELTLDPRPIAWPAIAMVFWGLGMAGLMGTWSVGYARFVRRLPEEQPAEPDWDAQWCGLLAAAGVRRAIRLRVTADVGPLLCRRLGGYELMIPAELWRDWNDAQRETILRHELAHYLRGDVWKSLAARVLMLPHWFNPAAWWAVRRFDEAGEWACDQMVLGYAPASTYAQTLLKLGEQVTFGRSPGLAARGASLAVRIRRLLLPPGGNELKWHRGAMIVAICVAATLALLRVELVAKQPARDDRRAEDDRPKIERGLPLDQFVFVDDPATAETAPLAMLAPNRSRQTSPLAIATPTGGASYLVNPYNPSARPPENFPRPQDFTLIPTDPSADFVPIPTDWNDAFRMIPNYPPKHEASELARRFGESRGEMNGAAKLHRWRYAQRAEVRPTPNSEGHAPAPAINPPDPNTGQPVEPQSSIQEKP